MPKGCIQTKNLQKRAVGGVVFVLTLQEQVVQKVNKLSEDNLQFLLEMIERFMQPEHNTVINFILSIQYHLSGSNRKSRIIIQCPQNDMCIN